MNKAGAMPLNQLSPHREQIDSYEQAQCFTWAALCVNAQCFIHASIIIITVMHMQPEIGLLIKLLVPNSNHNHTFVAT